MIVDTVFKIANYYKQMLLNKAGSYSIENYDNMDKDIEYMRANAKKTDYYLNHGWMKLGIQMPYLDKKMWDKVVCPFFGAARKYVEHKIAGTVYDSDEQEVALAVKRVENKVGKIGDKLRTNPKQKPMDYKKTVADTVHKIVVYYEAKLKKVENKISGKKYHSILAALDNLRDGADIDNLDFYRNYVWMNGDIGNVISLDYDMWHSCVMKFFSIVREYIDARSRGFSTKAEEEKVMRIVKLVNLKISGGILEGLKDVILPDSYFMVRRDMSK